jgi:hypothetical protein
MYLICQLAQHHRQSHTNLPKNNHRNIGKYNKLRVNGDDG